MASSASSLGSASGDRLVIASIARPLRFATFLMVSAQRSVLAIRILSLRRLTDPTVLNRERRAEDAQEKHGEDDEYRAHLEE